MKERHAATATLRTLLGTPFHRWRIFLALVVCCLTSIGTLGQTAWEPGKSYFGRSNYVEYIAGDLPLIISAPHGGTLKPAEIPDRKEGEFISDADTEDLVRTVQRAF